MSRRALLCIVIGLLSSVPVQRSFSREDEPQAGDRDVLDGWTELWTRDKDGGELAVDRAVRFDASASPSIRIEHRGTRDWSLGREERLDVRPGDLLELATRVRARGGGEAGISVVLYDRRGKVVDWMRGYSGVRGRVEWRALKSRLIVPTGVAQVWPRVTGSGPATVWVDGLRCEKSGTVDALRDPQMPQRVRVDGAAIAVALDTSDATFQVRSKKDGSGAQRAWRQKALGSVVVLRAKEADGGIDAELMWTATAQRVTLRLRLDEARPEFTVELSSRGKMDRPLRYPAPFVTDAGTYVVVPMNEGISYPVDDASVRPLRLVAYGGHGICMAFWGATDGAAGYMAILETPDDASIAMRRVDGRLAIAPEWDAQHGRFGYDRKLRYVFFERGGHVAMCKRYRAHAKAIGRFRTLAEKRKAIPAVDRLVGAVNVWCWDRDALGIVDELRAAGIERILWSHRRDPATIAAMNERGILTSRYDIFQDVMDPAVFPKLRGVHPDWPTAAWPDDIVLRASGEWEKGWRVTGKDGERYPCAVLCDSRAVPYAKRRLAKELETHPFLCRFIDTTTASQWRECRSPEHPMTRSESREHKMALLATVSKDFGLVTGSETGHDAAVPHLHYFEGMMSLGPYRVPEAGRDMGRIWDEVPERVEKFQLGHRYRLPLWELVYHDCVVSQWYWGDYNNKLPALWDRRDLFNALYGTPPMFMFRRVYWRQHKERFVRSYRTATPVARATGYSEMTDHRFLTANRDVQQTAFACGVTVTVNFGDESYALPSGVAIPSGKVHVDGLAEWRGSR